MESGKTEYGIGMDDIESRNVEDRPWRLRFWSVFGGQAISLIGSSLTQFVLIWWITDTTNSISALGIAGFAGLAPGAVLGPLGGVYADRYSRRVIMIVSDLISAACMAVLIFLFHTNQIELWHIYTMMAIRSATGAFQEPAASASVPKLVPPSFLSRAIALNQSLDGVLVVAGAPLGALVISVMPIEMALGIDVITMLMGVGPLLIFVIPQPSSTEKRASIWRQFRRGVDTVWHDLALRHMYTLLTVTVLVVMPLFTLIPLLIKEHFGGGAKEVAYFESLAGMGMILGGVLVSAIQPKRYVRWVLVGLSLACFATAISAGLPRNMFWISAAFWTFASFANVIGNSMFMTFLQSTVPNEVQGRVLSLLDTLMGIAAPVGLMFATPLGEIIGTRWLFVVLALVAGVILLLGFRSEPLMAMDARRKDDVGEGGVVSRSE